MLVVCQVSSSFAFFVQCLRFSLLLCCLLRFFCVCASFAIRCDPSSHQAKSIRSATNGSEVSAGEYDLQRCYPMIQCNKNHSAIWTWTNFCEAPFVDVGRLKVHEESWCPLSGVSKTSKHSVKSSVEWNPTDAAGMNLSQYKLKAYSSTICVPAQKNNAL